MTTEFILVSVILVHTVERSQLRNFLPNCFLTLIIEQQNNKLLYSIPSSLSVIHHFLPNPSIDTDWLQSIECQACEDLAGNDELWENLIFTRIVTHLFGTGVNSESLVSFGTM